MIQGVLLDEHYPQWWPGAITGMVPTLTVRWVGGLDAPALGTKDPAILMWLEANQFILVTNNRRTMAGHLAEHVAAGRLVEGIFLVVQDRHVRTIASELELIVGASMPCEFRDCILEMPLTQLR